MTHHNKKYNFDDDLPGWVGRPWDTYIVTRQKGTPEQERERDKLLATLDAFAEKGKRKPHRNHKHK